MDERSDEYKKVESLFNVVIEQVPTLPFMVVKLLEVTESDTSSANDIRKIIESDQALTAKTLKLANSTFYGRSRSVSNIKDAIVLMGLNAVKNMAICLSVRDLFNGKGNTGFNLQSFWLHSLACGLCARDVSKQIKVPFAEEALVCGMLHDIGKALLNQYLPDEYRKVIERTRASKISIGQVEEEILGVDHAVVGSWLLKIWKFPKLLSDGIRFHHQSPEQLMNGEPSSKLAAIANLCDTIVLIQRMGSGGDEVARDTNKAIIKYLGLTEDDVSRIAAELHEKVWKVASSMGFSTERKTHFEILGESNRKLQESEEKYRILFESSSDSIFLMSDVILDCNEQACRLLGCEHQEILGHSLLDFSPPTQNGGQSSAELFSEKVEAASGETPSFFYWRCQRKDGVIIDTEVSLKALTIGNKPLLQAAMRDVTEHRRMEQKLAEQNEELKLQTQKALETSRLKSEFLANVSHEIRTPLNAIIGFARLLEEDLENPLKDNQREFIGYIVSGGENLLNIINDILDLSKIEAGKITLENMECSPREIVDELHNMFRQRTAEKGIDLRVSYEDGMSDRVLSDPTRLRQILLNLIGNAVKFTDKGYVEIGVQRGNNYPDYFEFYVRDTGIGIPQEKIESIFKPFEQVDGSITRKYGGTGLGLTVASRLIGLMGGEINVISQLGKGSTFYFQIPYEPVKVEAEKPSEERTDAPQISNKVRKYILAAEDNDLNYTLIEVFLTKNGFSLMRARNGEDAISVYKTKRDVINLILMDVRMPVLGGLEATEVIRKYDDGIPIIALTAHAMKGDRERFLEVGCTDYISKPLKPSELLEKIKKYIK